ncbi:filamentous hemagglutinin N-terminal domain-containing protein [Halomonas sp. MCCC 1A11036]|uniref:Filamentous hemagglutinin N-terminal domain-containing protein n=1 Tax=Billgrantia zhangzhouensis TaxID=2733481 RepID=A0ABS9AJ89_9GAMM|nr:filamentous hemagglutinin N-terminal domain-containing protein [Halomonas zhangzhouensis]MCE8021838.1 filamentous hemagglutinin N-terminal domain-containing protein [Halomonas zhangzhouensis]
MNRQCYRLVFNRAKGQLVAASELAVASGKSPAEGSRVGRWRSRRQPAIAATLAALLLGSPAVQASIASDPNAPGNQRPTVLETANGVPQVNIQTPSAAGVSRNSYRQFDVSSKGAILNNSRRNTQTQLSGWVQGNPHLTSGEARVILNEVNSANPSQLRGYLEVAGSRAEVVIANPAGIDVNGAGFINASRATLTTGTPELRNGELTGYRVQQGTVTISGAGLDASGTDYTAVLARAIEVQGGVWANDLNVVTGANRIGTDGQVIERLTSQGDAPAVAIDVAHLGGMYAGKITLVATEAGVGVNNAGSLTATQAGGVGDVVLTAEGRIVNRGAITAEGDIQLASQTRIDNLGTGAVLAQGDLTLSATGAQGRIRSTSDATLAAGVDAGSLRLGNNGQLTLTAGDNVTTQGRNLAAGGFLAEADTVSLAGSETQARDIDVTARRGDLDASGAALSARDTLTASADATLRTDGASVQAERLDLSAAAISNRDGELIQAGNDTLHLATGTLDNRGGRVAANADIVIRTDALDNAAGTVRAGGSLDLEAETLDNTQGQLVAERDLHVTATQLTNTQGLMGAVQGSLDVEAQSLDNSRGRIEAADGLRLDVADSLTNEGGEIVQLSDQGELQIAAANLHGSDGLIVSQGDLTVEGGEIVLDGARTQAQHIALQADSLSHREGELLHLGSDAPLTFDVAQALNNRNGLIASNAALDLTAGELSNREGAVQAAGDAYVTAASLDNRQGELVSGGTLGLTVEGNVANAQGQLLAQRSLDLQVASLNNAGGTLGAVEGDLTVAADSVIDNRGGTLEAGNQLDVSGQGLDNQRGTLVGERVSLDTGGQRLNNMAGLIAAGDSLASISGELDNTGGTLQASGDAMIDTLGQALINVDSGADGGILANGALTLAAGDIVNGNGLIGGGRLDVTAVEIANRLGGTLLSESDLTLTANSLDNRGGQLQALGDMTLDLNEALLNQGGLIRSGAALKVNASRVVNSNTQGADQGIEGQSIDLSAEEAVNQQGAMRANQRLEIDAASRVDNRNGLLSSLDTLTVEAEEIDNQGGTLIANQRLILELARLFGNGRVLSLGDLALQLASDFTLNQGAELKAAGDLHFATSGTLTNRGTLQAGDTLDLDASEIRNTASGELSATTTRLSAGQLTNHGLIDGVTTRIDAITLDNLGTGRIYGDRLGIQATTLTNDVENSRAAAIAARERLDIGTRRLTNREEALLFSAGDMAIGGRLDADDRATGQATRVDNNSATIEALGDLSISAVSLRNTNEHFETELQYSGSETGLFYQPVGWDEKRPSEEFRKTYYSLYHDATGTAIKQVPNGRLFCCAGNTYIRWREFDIEREVYSSQVTRSAPGLIQGGGNVSLRGESIVNDKSKIVAGAVLRGDLENVVNLEARGQRSIVENGLVRSLGYYHFHSEHGGEAIPYTSSWEFYTDQESLSDIILPVTELGGNRNVSSSGAQIGTLQPTSLSGSASGAGNATAGVGGFESGRGIVEVPAIGRSGSAVQASSFEAGDVIRTLTPQLQLPSNSLFQLKPTGIRPLVETDPRFTNQRQWLSSDYLLSALHPDPAMTQKRLGDGFYEQRLIREQVTQLTGQRFLEGYADDEAQYAALMNNAATFAKAHGLRPGVALTAEQMAQLTSDIVWLVEQTVTLADGSTVKVLVPQVYARLREGDLKGDGTLIAGDSLQMDIAGDLANTGTLAGRELVEMTAGNITNLEGRISGNRIDLETRRDLTNLGGDITANESLSMQAGRDLNLANTAERQARLYLTDSGGQLLAGAGRDLTIRGAEVDSAGTLALGAGRDLSIASTLDTQSNRYGRVTLNTADIEHQATLSAGQDLILNAGRDLSLAAVDVSAGGNGLIAAGRDLALETLATGSAMSGGRLQRSQQQEVGTTLAIGNDLTLMAGQDLYARAADVSVAGDLGVIAGRNIEIEAGQSSQYEERRWGRTHTIDSQSRVQGSDFAAGGSLSLTAGEDLRLTASRLQAGEDAALLAGGDIELLTAQEHDYSLYESRRRGTFGGSRTQRDEVSKTRAIGSEVSSGGDLFIASGQDQTYRAARLEADGDIELQSGGRIRFETASDVHSESHERSKSSFVSQSARGQGSTVETLRQNELMAQGDIRIHAEQGIHALYEARDGESLDAAIERVVADNPGLAWLQALQGRDDVTWESLEAFQDEWHYSHSGLSPIATTILTAVVSYYTAGAVSGMVGNLSGAAAGSQATFAAGATTASGTTIAAGSGNAILSGMAGGAAGGGVGAFSQGGDWREAAWRGGITGAFTGHLSAGTYYDNPINMAGDAYEYFMQGNAMGLASVGMHLGLQQVYGEVQQKIADGVGLNPDELNWLLMASSIAGNSVAGSRFWADDQEFEHTRGTGTTGFFSRDKRPVVGSIFDLADSALGYQDLPDATVRDYLVEVGVGQPAAGGHSLGTITQSYLARHGLVESTYLESVPFGIVAPPNAEVRLGRGDIINGFGGGMLFNWHGKIVPTGLFQHSREFYEPFRPNTGGGQ